MMALLGGFGTFFGPFIGAGVFQLFGDALTIMNKKTGVFASVATGAGKVVDNLATRMTVAITSARIPRIHHGERRRRSMWRESRSW